MEEITYKQYLEKYGQMLEKYRSNVIHLSRIRDDIEKQFFMPEEMVQYFYSNKSEFYTWQQTQDSIVTLEDAYSELVGSMMDALGDPESYKYYLKDQRIPVLVLQEDEEEKKKDKEKSKDSTETEEDDDINIDDLLKDLETD